MSMQKKKLRTPSKMPKKPELLRAIVTTYTSLSEIVGNWDGDIPGSIRQQVIETYGPLVELLTRANQI